MSPQRDDSTGVLVAACLRRMKPLHFVPSRHFLSHETLWGISDFFTIWLTFVADFVKVCKGFSLEW